MSARRRALAVGALLLSASPALRAQACTASSSPPHSTSQQCSVDVPVSLTVGTLVRVHVSAASLGAPTFDVGHRDDPGPVITVHGNRPWSVVVRGGSALWSASQTVLSVAPRANKPVGDLRWSLTDGGTYTPLTTTDAPVASSSATNGTVIPIYLRTMWDLALDTPGQYSMTLVVMLTAS